jgi:hypothetical protein
MVVAEDRLTGINFNGGSEDWRIGVMEKNNQTVLI